MTYEEQIKALDPVMAHLAVGNIPDGINKVNDVLRDSEIKKSVYKGMLDNGAINRAAYDAKMAANEAIIKKYKGYLKILNDSATAIRQKSAEEKKKQDTIVRNIVSPPLPPPKVKPIDGKKVVMVVIGFLIVVVLIMLLIKRFRK